MSIRIHPKKKIENLLVAVPSGPFELSSVVAVLFIVFKKIVSSLFFSKKKKTSIPTYQEEVSQPRS